MKKIKNKLAKWWERQKLNLLTFVLALPSLLSLVGLFVQGFYFATTGTWLLPAEQLAIGAVTSILFWITGYRSFVYFEQLKSIKDVK